MDRSEQRGFVRALARQAVREVAPEELPFFAATSDSYFRDPDHVLAGRRRGDEVLGSGFNVLITLVSPVALAVATVVYQQLADRAGEVVVRQGKRWWQRVLRRRERLTETPVSFAPLTDEQRAELRRVAVARARALGLAEDKVQLLVSAIMDGIEHRE